MSSPEDAVLACAETALARLLHIFDDHRFAPRPQPWWPTLLTWQAKRGKPENYRCVIIPPQIYRRHTQAVRYALAGRWLAATHPAEALSLTFSTTPSVVGDQLTVINVMSARYTRRGIAPEGLTADIVFKLDRPIADDFEVTWLAYPERDSLMAEVLAMAVGHSFYCPPSDELMVDAALRTWYEDPI